MFIAQDDKLSGPIGK